MKKCSKCRIEKDLNQFHKNKNSKDSFVTICKECKFCYDKQIRSFNLHNNINFKYEMNTCRVCLLNKHITFFCSDKTKKMGIKNLCKECSREKSKKYREQVKKKNKEFKLSIIEKRCPDCNNVIPISEFYTNPSSLDGFSVYCKTHSYKRNKKYDPNFERSKRWQKNNPDKRKEQRRLYNQSHKEKIAKYEKERRKNNLYLRLRNRISCAVYFAIKSCNAIKDHPTWSKLPYTPKQLKEHIEKHFNEYMTWENYGNYWEIDHLYPQSLLLYDSLEHPNFLKCWSLENLRPLEKIKNRKKGNKVSY